MSYQQASVPRLKFSRLMEQMAKRIVIKGLSSSQLKRLSKRKRYLVVTGEGVEFTDRLSQVDKVPSNLCRLYQLLLKLTRMGGTASVKQVRRFGFTPLTIGRVISKGYVNIFTKPVKPSADVQKKIEEMKGEAPVAIYA